MKPAFLALILFAAAALLPVLGRGLKRGELLLSFLSVLLCAGGIAAGVLNGNSLIQIGSGAAAVLLVTLCVRERSEKG